MKVKDYSKAKNDSTQGATIAGRISKTKFFSCKSFEVLFKFCHSIHLTKIFTNGNRALVR